jgi:hypothetical protein
VMRVARHDLPLPVAHVQRERRTGALSLHTEDAQFPDSDGRPSWPL